MIAHTLAALSAALGVIGWGCALFCLARLRQTWGEDLRRNLLMLGIVLVAIGLATQATVAFLAYELKIWESAPGYPTPALIGYRILWLAGLLTVAGAASYPMCGHRGWQALVGLGALAALLSALF